MQTKISATGRGCTLLMIMIIFSLWFYGCVPQNPDTPEKVVDVAVRDMIDGGKLYDNWWKELKGTEEPGGNHPLWQMQATNKRTGSATWRCKECHGWDYKGKDGVYGTGSHKTGFPGVYDARTLPVEELEAILKGKTNPDHDFSPYMNDAAIRKLSVFISIGLIDLDGYVDPGSKQLVNADSRNGEVIYVKTKCHFCHGKDGGQIAKENDEFLGAVANSNPWEFIHKTRFGEPGKIMPALKVRLNPEEKRENMPSGIEGGYTIQDMADLVEYSRTLPYKTN
jgi:thiosulfate dehydrogenase